MLIIVLLFLLLLHKIFFDGSHKLLIFLHCLKGLLNLFECKQIREVRAKLKEFLQVGVVLIILYDATFNQYSVEILRLHDLDSLVLIRL